jgi:SNF2 family DNA or RNA helicase
MAGLKLHDYQEKARAFVNGRDRAALWLMMGSGKTSTTLHIMADWLDNQEVDRVLIVSTLRVVKHVWTGEEAKWGVLGGYRWSSVLGDAKTRQEAAKRSAEIYLVNIDNLDWLVKEYGLKGWKWDAVVLDESTLFKSSSSKRFKALKSVLPKVKKMVQLTGTPSPNGIEDLYTQAYLLDDGARLGRTKKAFTDTYFNKGYMQWDITPKPGAMKDITDRLKDVVMTLEPSDYQQMEPYTHNHIKIDLGANLKVYKRFEREMLLDMGNTEITAVNAAVLVNKLAQYANGMMYDDDKQVQLIHQAKLDALEEIAQNLGNMIVVYRYKHDLVAIRSRMAVTEARDPGAIDAWNAGKIKVLAVHPRSAGHGLNLQQGGHDMVWYGPTWSLEEHQQTIARIYRQGQANRVIINTLVAADTVDELICAALGAKDNEQKTLINLIKSIKKPFNSN